MIITREKGMRMWGGGSGSTSASGVNGGGGFSLAVTEGEGTGNAYTGFTYESGVLSLIKGEKFVTVDFFNRLFTAYDANGTAIVPNDTTTAINNLKLMVGTWTEEYLSALGKNSEGGGGGGDFDEAQMWTALQSTSGTYATTKIATSHIPDMASTYGYLKSSALSGYATQAWVNQQGFLTTHQTLYTLSIYGGTTKVLDFKPNANASIYIKAGGDISLTNDTTNKYITLSYTHPTNGANTTISAANGKVLSAITVNNLGHVTSVSSKTLAAADIPDISATYATASRATTLEGYFTNGVAKTAAKLNTGTTTYTAWGQTYWSSGVPQSISGNMTSVGSITPSANGNNLGTSSARFNIYGTAGNFSGNVSIGGTLGVTGATTLTGLLTANGGIVVPSSKTIKIGDCTISWDSTNSMLKFDTGIYSTGAVSALGSNSSGGGSGTFDEEAMWTALGTTSTAKVIASSHIPNLDASKITSGTFAAARIPDLSSKYLPLTGGTLQRSSGDTPLYIKTNNASGAYIGYKLNDDTTMGFIGVHATHGAAYVNNGTVYPILRSDNYSSYALPLSGGTIATNSAYPLIIADSRSSSTLFVATGYKKGSTTLGYLGFSSQDVPVYVSSNAGNSYPLLHLDNYSSYALPLSGGTITLSSIDGLTINKSNNAAGMIRFTNGSTLLGYLGYYGIENPACNVGGTYYSLVHEGNYDSIIGNSYIRRKTYGLDGGKAVRITFNNVNGGIINVRSTLANASLILVGNGYGDEGTIRNNWVQLSHTTSSFSWCIPTASGIEKSVEIYNNTSNSASVVVASFDTGVTFTELSALSTTASTVKVAYASDYLPLTGGTLTGSIKMDATAKGYYLVDSAGVSYPALFDNGSYLCIGANAVSGTHHTGNTYISAGSGEVYISRLVNNSRANYKNLDAGNTYVSSGIGYINGNEITTISGNAATATKATQDGSGRTITSTYLTDIGINSNNNLTQTKNGTASIVGHLLERNHTIRYAISAAGWYRIGTFINPMNTGNVCFLLIRREYNATSNESYVFAITTNYSGGITISQLSGQAYTRQMTKIRVDYVNNTTTKPAIDIYVSTADSNNYAFTIIGSAQLSNTATHNPTLIGSQYEYSTVSGMGTSRNFTAVGEVTASSDARLKTIVGDATLSLKDIANAPNVLFRWNDGRDDKVHGGSIAQYWLQKASQFVCGEENGFYSLNYGALATSMAISIAKEVVKHDDEITRLKKEVVKLRERVAELEERRIA